ncbi:MAG: YdeI/OmpD-associated family protein, partial [Actinomycetota bacterium]
MPAPAPGPGDVRIFPSAADFRAWLLDNHDRAPEVWVGYYRKSSGRHAMTYPEAVEEALCFGWIDGIARRVDDEVHTNRFTPRRKGSSWSAVNIAKIAELRAAGRMHPAGLRVFEGGDVRRDAGYLYERPPADLPAGMLERLRAERGAWAHWEGERPSFRRCLPSRCARTVRAARRGYPTLSPPRPAPPAAWRPASA